MLLAAGRGSRMGELTDTTAKPLLQINGTSLIDIHLHKLAASGVREVVINLNWHAEKIMEHVAGGKKYNVKVKYSHEPSALETAGGVAQALHLLGPDPFLLISSDVWSDIDYSELARMRLTGMAHLIMVDNPAHHPHGDFTLKDSKVVPKQAPQSLTYSGIGVFHTQMFGAAIDKRMPLRDVLLPAIYHRQVSGSQHSGRWIDVGTPGRLSKLELLLKNHDKKHSSFRHDR